MKTAFALLLTAGLLASCTPKSNTSTTDTTTTTTGTATTGTDTAGTMPTDTAGTATTDATGTTTTTTPDTAATGTAAAPADPTATDTTAAGATDTTGTSTTDTTTTTTTTDTSTASGQSMEGKISTYDGTAQTFTMQQDGKDYNVTVTPSTTYQGQATSASDFFGTDRANADVTVEGTPSGSDMAATSVTLK